MEQWTHDPYDADQALDYAANGKHLALGLDPYRGMISGAGDPDDASEGEVQELLHNLPKPGAKATPLDGV
eukprot:8843657-Prorocentrum_lima.AAC.1